MILGDVPYELGHQPKLRALSTGKSFKMTIYIKFDPQMGI